MKLRASVTAFVLSVAIPCAFAEIGLEGPLASPSALAQGDVVTEVARQRYEEGQKFFAAGRFEDARSAFLQTYALKRDPAVLLNLGQSELRSGHYEDAGNHLQQFLRLTPGASAADKAAAEKGIAEARKKSAFIIVIADANGAAVSIDGTSVGITPLLDPVFVKAGKHTLLATYQNKNATTQVDAKVGTATAASLTLGTTGSALPPSAPPAALEPTPTAPLPAAPPPPLGAGSASPPPAWSPATGPAASSPPALAPTASFQMGGMGGMGPDQGVIGQRESFYGWYKRKPLAWVGTGLAGVGLGLGIGFSLAASVAGSTADDHAQTIKDYSKTDPATNNGQLKPCGSTERGGGDIQGYEKACTVLREDLSDYNTDVTIATVSYIVGGVALAGTVAYAMIDWYPKKKAKTASQGPRVLSIAPVISPTQQGVGVIGTF